MIDRDAPQTWAEFVDVLPDERRRRCPAHDLPMVVVRSGVTFRVQWECVDFDCGEMIAIDQAAFMRWVTKRRGPPLVGRFRVR